MKLIQTVFFLALIPMISFSQSPYVGKWEGDIVVPGGKLGVIFTIEEADGKFSCSMDVPMQGATGIEADRVAIGDELELGYNSLGASYVGALDEAGKILGKWTQSGQTFDLNLSVFVGEKKLERPQHPEPPYPYEVEDIIVSAKDGAHQLAGTLTHPKGEGPFPTAIMVTGSGPQDRDETILGHKPFLVIADYFAKNGIATFRYDDRGVGGSTGNFEEATTQDFTEDALAVLNEISKHQVVDAEKIGIVGHSEGGLVCALAAAESKAVKYVIMLAGPGVPGVEVLKRQIGDISLANGESEEDIQKSSQLNAKLIDLAASGKSKEEKMEAARTEIRRYYDKILTEEEREEAGDFESVYKMSTQGLFSKWMHYFLNLDPRKYIERISCPTLALIGGSDTQVSPAVNIPALKIALEIAPTTDWEVIEVPNLNHLFQTSRTGAPKEYGEIPETFSPQVMIMMRDWLKKL